jgi:Ca2+-binding RTX toxin-like protein
MFLFHRKALTAAGCTAAAVAATTLFAMPAQAASAGAAKVVGSSAVQFNALLGKSNGLTITISGRTVTLDDKVAIKAGKGCKAVKGDKTKVKCKTSKKTSRLSVALGDKNDWVVNKTSVYMLADGGSGTDKLTGGSAADQLQGGTGNDKLYGKGGIDTLFGGSGNDHLVGSTGNDRIDAGPGADKAYGEAGNDLILGGSGNDTLSGAAGNDEIAGGSDNDTITGAAGHDVLVGDAGNDQIAASTGDDVLYGDAGNDTIAGDAGKDIIFAEAGNDNIAGGDGDDILYGKAGNDTIAGNKGDDVLIGEDIVAGQPYGSDAARDRLDGGANATALGDYCLAMAAGTVRNCEATADSALARTAAPAAQLEVARQAQTRAAAARAAVK